MDHSFNKQVAILYGVEEATMIHNLVHWIEKNQANDKHFYDGTYWTYNSIRAFCEMFPYWTKRQIERILNNIVDKGAVKTSAFNKLSYDRTKWYAILDARIFEYYGLFEDDFIRSESLSRNGEMQLPIPLNEFPQTGSTIPDSKTDSKQDVSNDTSNGELSTPTPRIVKLSINQKCQMFIDNFNKIRGTKFQKNKSLCGQLNARLEEKYTTKQIFTALRNAMNDSYHRETLYKHLTPEFILRSDKIDKFLNISTTGVPAPESDEEKRTLVH